jgi:hypothetical protein
MTDAFMIIAKLVKLPVELAGYIQGLHQNGIIRTIRDAFQMGIVVANPVPGFGLTTLLISIVFIAILLINDLLMRNTPEETILKQKPFVLRWAGYYALIITILISWNAGSSQFIYFTF